MDIYYSLHVKNTATATATAAATTITTNLLQLRNYSILEKPNSSWNMKKMMKKTVSPSGSCYSNTYRSFVVRAMAKKNPSSSGNGDKSIPEGDGLKGRDPSSGNNESNDAASQKAHPKPLDWREFRALLYINEQTETAASETPKKEKASCGSRQLPLKWAHPISAPENGCLLVASEKLDGVRNFERTVVLLLRSGTRHPQEGPFGVVINRPLHKKIKHMNPYNHHLATTFAECSLHFGGPLEASMFLLRAEENSGLSGFEEVIPGVCFGSRYNLEEAGGLVQKGILKPHDFRFFFGYAGWQLDQLREEIESGYWHVAACSANLVCGSSQNASTEGLWEEVLQLMGGHYSELSRKPKQDF